MKGREKRGRSVPPVKDLPLLVNAFFHNNLAQLLRENVSFLHSPTPTNASVGDCFSTLLLQPLYNNKIMLGLFSFSL